jgi:hypothetical protein
MPNLLIFAIFYTEKPIANAARLEMGLIARP